MTMPSCGECRFFKPDVVNDEAFIESHDGVIGPFDSIGGCHGYYEYLRNEGENLDVYYTVDHEGRRYIVLSSERDTPPSCPLFVPKNRDIVLSHKLAKYKRGDVLFPDCITLTPSREGGDNER